MARTGVTYSEVADAAQELVGQGRNPTVEQVRLILGTGSSTTIANHLRQWKANQSSTDSIALKENLPNELVSVMKGLWERVLNHSQEKIDIITKEHEQTVVEFQQELEKYKSNNQRWQKLYDLWLQEKNQLAQEKLTLEQALEFALKENNTLHAKEDGFRQQLQEKQARIEELTRLNAQAQANLEHYREAAREQRLLDQKQHEQERQQLQSEIKQFNDQLALQREKVIESQQQLKIMQQSYSVLEKDYASIQSSTGQLNNKLQETELAKLEFQRMSQHWELHYKDSQTLQNKQVEQLIQLQVENKQLVNQLQYAQEALNKSQGQNELLAHDKWLLAQEKSQLEGQLKQVQISLNSGRIKDKSLIKEPQER